MVAKDLNSADVTMAEYLTTKYALWLDMRATDDDKIHGNGRRVDNASEGITLEITKKAQTAGALKLYIYLIMDAQLNIANGRFVESVY